MLAKHKPSLRVYGGINIEPIIDRQSHSGNIKENEKRFSVKYCEECKSAWEFNAGSGRSNSVEHYEDFPMARQLDYILCPFHHQIQKRKELIDEISR